ncbi:MAG: GC-type dockerin domain-anchored protein [Phycisphaerales bacterium JB061]
MTHARIIVAASVACTAASASAQNFYVTDQTTFTAGLTDFAVEDFDNGANKVLPDETLVFDDFTVSFIEAGGHTLGDDLFFSGTSGGGVSTAYITFDRPVLAIGANQFDSNTTVSAGIDGVYSDVYQIDVVSPFPGAQIGDFCVVEFTEPITQIRFFPLTSFSMAYEIDNLVIAYAPEPCTADVNGDGMLTPTDFTAWIGAFNTNAPECDQNSDGACTPTDFTAWVGNYNAGC